MTQTQSQTFISRDYSLTRVSVILLVIGAAILFALSYLDFLAFHTVIELVTVALAAWIYFKSLRERRRRMPQIVQPLGVLFGCVALVDLIHTLLYYGMFNQISSPNPATQMWVIGRSLQSFGLFLVIGCQLTRLNSIVFPLLTGAAILSVYPLGVFPDAYEPGIGQTTFKINSEYLIMALLCITGVLFHLRLSKNDHKRHWAVYAALSTMLVSEFCFTHYISIYSISNVLGHLFKLVSFYFMAYYIVVLGGMSRASATSGHVRSRSVLNASALAMVLVLGFVAVYEYDSTNEQQRVSYTSQFKAHQIAATLETKLETRLHLTDALSAFVKHSQSFSQEEFDTFAATIEEPFSGIISVQLAPKGIVTYVSKLERNRSAIGFNLLAGDRQRAAAQRAIDTHQKIVVGPIDLIQGGRAIIGRQPIFVSGGTASQEVFWGFATVLIDFDQVIASLDNDVFLRDTRFAIKGIGEDGMPTLPFAGTLDTFVDALATSELRLGGSAWIVAVANAPGAISGVSRFIESPWYWLLTLILATLVFYYSYIILERPHVLQERINESTDSLNRALSSLKEENEKRNRVYGMIAHELRTPVSAISMMSQVKGDSQWLDSKSDIALASQTLLDTLDDMRMVINPHLQRPLRLAAFRIDGLIEQIVNNVQSIVASSGFKLECRIRLSERERTHRFETDTYRLRIAIINLIRNACLHSGGGQVVLDVQTTLDEDEVERLEFQISDDGEGISEDLERNLFSPYRRGASSSDGMGLGLYISRTWIEEIGGTVELTQARPSAIFTVKVPVVFAKSETDQANERPDHQMVREEVRQWNTLLVEDDLMIRMIGDKFLADRAASVATAANGIDGLKLVKQHQYDLIITDYFMPEMTGEELIREVRKQGFSGYIIGLTAATLGDQIEKLEAAGADAVILKPITDENFFSTIAELLEHRKL